MFENYFYIQDVIDYLQKIVDDKIDFSKDDHEIKDYKKALEIAQYLLKDMICMEPVHTKDENGNAIIECPRCTSNVSNITTDIFGNGYCTCGQLLYIKEKDYVRNV